MLTLPVKGKWYDMILSGEKLEEYRANTSYYAARFARHKGRSMRLLFRNGYGADRPTMEAVVVPQFRTGAKPEWGGDPETICWVLEIREANEVSRGNGDKTMRRRRHETKKGCGSLPEPRTGTAI